MKILEIDTERQRLGRFGERAAARLLRRSGYRIRAKNFAPFDHEVDIVCENREYIVFVEVKTRSIENSDPREPRPASSVTPKKQRSVITAAKQYLAYYPSDKKKRLDIIEVYVTHKNGRNKVAEIKHLENTFNINSSRAGVRAAVKGRK